MEFNFWNCLWNLRNCFKVLLQKQRSCRNNWYLNFIFVVVLFIYIYIILIYFLSLIPLRWRKCKLHHWFFFLPDLVSQSGKSCNINPSQLLSNHPTAFECRPKPENLNVGDFYVIHQKLISYCWILTCCISRPFVSGSSLLEIVRFAGVKFIALKVTFCLFIPDHSITWLIMPPVFQSLEDSTQNLFLT